MNLDGKDRFLAQTLLDLSQTATIDHSLKLGGAVLAELGQVNTLHKARVEQAGFAVLKAPDVPSILVETAFISNPEEEKRLARPGLPGQARARDPRGHQALLRQAPAAAARPAGDEIGRAFRLPAGCARAGTPPPSASPRE